MNTKGEITMWGTRLRQGVLITIFLVVLMPSSSTLASEEQINAVGSYTMGQDDTLQKAQDSALNEALRSATEQIGVYVKSYTRVDDFAVTKDQIEVSAEHTMKLVSKRFERSVTPSGDIHIKAYIDVTYDPDAVIADLQRLMQDSQMEEPHGQPMTLHLSFGDMEGLYDGELNAEGLPNGQGRFSWETGDGVPITYEGAFRNGHFHGQGKMSWSNGHYEEGNYVNDDLNGYGKKYDSRQPELNYEGNFLHGWPMLDAVNMGESVTFDEWSYTATRLEKTKRIDLGTPPTPIVRQGHVDDTVQDGNNVIVYINAKNSMPYTRQLGVSLYFGLFNRTNGEIYPFDIHTMIRLFRTMTENGISNPVWGLMDIPGNTEVQSIPFLFNVPKETKIEDLLLFPSQGMGKVAPIQLQEP